VAHSGAVNKAGDHRMISSDGPLRNSIKLNRADLIQEIVDTYQKHGWTWARALLTPEAHAEMADGEVSFESVTVETATVDALWFSRPSHNRRQAWELRLLAESPFALFETLEPDETEEQREEMRREMEARLRDFVNR